MSRRCSVIAIFTTLWSALLCAQVQTFPLGDRAWNSITDSMDAVFKTAEDLPKNDLDLTQSNFVVAATQARSDWNEIEANRTYIGCSQNIEQTPPPQLSLLAWTLPPIPQSAANPEAFELQLNALASRLETSKPDLAHKLRSFFPLDDLIAEFQEATDKRAVAMDIPTLTKELLEYTKKTYQLDIPSVVLMPELVINRLQRAIDDQSFTKSFAGLSALPFKDRSELIRRLSNRLNHNVSSPGNFSATTSLSLNHFGPQAKQVSIAAHQKTILSWWKQLGITNALSVVERNDNQDIATIIIPNPELPNKYIRQTIQVPAQGSLDANFQKLSLTRSILITQNNGTPITLANMDATQRGQLEAAMHKVVRPGSDSSVTLIDSDGSRFKVSTLDVTGGNSLGLIQRVTVDKGTIAQNDQGQLTGAGSAQIATDGFDFQTITAPAATSLLSAERYSGVPVVDSKPNRITAPTAVTGQADGVGVKTQVDLENTSTGTLLARKVDGNGGLTTLELSQQVSVNQDPTAEALITPNTTTVGLSHQQDGQAVVATANINQTDGSTAVAVKSLSVFPLTNGVSTFVDLDLNGTTAPTSAATITANRIAVGTEIGDQNAGLGLKLQGDSTAGLSQVVLTGTTKIDTVQAETFFQVDPTTGTNTTGARLDGSNWALAGRANQEGFSNAGVAYKTGNLISSDAGKLELSTGFSAEGTGRQLASATVTSTGKSGASDSATIIQDNQGGLNLSLNHTGTSDEWISGVDANWELKPESSTVTVGPRVKLSDNATFTSSATWQESRMSNQESVGPGLQTGVTFSRQTSSEFKDSAQLSAGWQRGDTAFKAAFERSRGDMSAGFEVGSSKEDPVFVGLRFRIGRAPASTPVSNDWRRNISQPLHGRMPF